MPLIRRMDMAQLSRRTRLPYAPAFMVVMVLLTGSVAFGLDWPAHRGDSARTAITKEKL